MTHVLILNAKVRKKEWFKRAVMVDSTHWSYVQAHFWLQKFTFFFFSSRNTIIKKIVVRLISIFLREEICIALYSVCMFDKLHLMLNFKSKVSHDVFKKKKWMSIDMYILLKCHLNVICLVVRVISICKVSIDMRFFSSQVTLHVKF